MVAAGQRRRGAALLGVLSASASYIAAPAAIRLSLPAANPTLSLTAALAITSLYKLPLRTGMMIAAMMMSIEWHMLAAFIGLIFAFLANNPRTHD